MSSVPLIAGPGRRHYDEIKRMKGTSTVDSRIWLWHQHEFEARGTTREALILEGGLARSSPSDIDMDIDSIYDTRGPMAGAGVVWGVKAGA